MKPHKHAKVIKAWADGAKIEYRNNNMKDWDDMPECSPLWFETVEYRIKPEPKQDVVQFWNMCKDGYSTYMGEPPKHYVPYNLRLIFDGETGKLKSAEVLGWKTLNT